MLVSLSWSVKKCDTALTEQWNLLFFLNMPRWPWQLNDDTAIIHNYALLLDSILQDITLMCFRAILTPSL